MESGTTLFCIWRSVHQSTTSKAECNLNKTHQTHPSYHQSIHDESTCHRLLALIAKESISIAVSLQFGALHLTSKFQFTHTSGDYLLATASRSRHSMLRQHSRFFLVAHGKDCTVVCPSLGDKVQCPSSTSVQTRQLDEDPVQFLRLLGNSGAHCGEKMKREENSVQRNKIRSANRISVHQSFSSIIQSNRVDQVETYAVISHHKMNYPASAVGHVGDYRISTVQQHHQLSSRNGFCETPSITETPDLHTWNRKLRVILYFKVKHIILFFVFS